MTSRDEPVVACIVESGFAVRRAEAYDLGAAAEDWRRLQDDWSHLETDRYMADGGQYRLRRFGRFWWKPATSELLRLPHGLVFQARYINNFAGGIHRDFAPLRETTFANPFLHALIRFDFSCFTVADERMLHDPWEVWVHQIRIETAGPVVQPAPEGIHHDGHDFIAMHLVQRDNVDGAESHLYDNDRNPIHRCMLLDPLDTIYADDHRVMHAVGGLSAADPARPARRDILIIDFDHRPNLVKPQ
jgi:hypothetical protein